jgi:methylisocitrate lyase
MRAPTKLRAALLRGPVIAPGCYDALSARLAEAAGFELIHLTGFGVEATQLGAPDLGLMSMTELSSHAARIAAAVDVPILADVDTGFGGVLLVQRTIRLMEQAGVAGVHIEDQRLPKHCPLIAGRAVVSRDDAIDRLKAALDARVDHDFVIVARSDADIVSYDELVDRCGLYLEAGADLVMPMLSNLSDRRDRSFSSLEPDEQIAFLRKLLADIGGPAMSSGRGPPAGKTVHDLTAAGYSIVILALAAASAAANAMADMFKRIRDTGSDSAATGSTGPYDSPMEILKLMRLDRYVEAERRYASGAVNER